ncbi:two-component system sensor histidine kinase NtrB [Edaphobacter modestus]|uniref:histidine kinase n=1 Tax=Edaphobacter modestus TaxID=388466 RepID=A0A4Q7YZR7_9BACT|nr:PAS domain S-box protein [Edaphobacter modestus]RZU43318.1 PAS domain S-box-containing protein [Edaphobacter modestus]
MSTSGSVPRANGVEEETETVESSPKTRESSGPTLWTPNGKQSQPASSNSLDSRSIARLWQEEPDRSYALLAAIVESSDDAIISSDLDGTITSWNRGAERVFGYTAAEMLGNSTSELASPTCQEDTERVLEKIRRGESVDHYETLRRHKDGSEIIVSMTVSPIRNSSGILIGASKVSRDITNTRRAEQSMRNADKLALAGRMAASIAHEINNPLEAITNLLYLVEHETLSDEARTYLTLAQHELGRVSHIASQTLGFFRNNRGPSSTLLSEIVDSALSLHLGRLTTSNVAIHREYAPLASLFVHQGELRQVLANLIGNALDAMPAGGRLRVRIRKALDPVTKTSGARIIIADTGTGMNRATMRQIFEPFYTTKGSAGTGLGLWVSSQIVARHKGHILVRSSQSPQHSGTVFSIFLPHLTEATSSYSEEGPASPSQQLSLPIAEMPSTSREDASRHTHAEPDPQSTAYNAA